jgi:membrane-associated phospholipid phosphatase
MPLRLPAIQSTTGHVAAAVATTAACALMYAVPQHWQFARAVELPLTPIDRAVPFLPVSGLAYFGAFIFLGATFLALRDRAQATRFLYASLLAQAVGMLCFLLWPVQYPRELYPLPAHVSELGAALVAHVRSSDAPVNCLPSLHVSTAVICALSLRGRRWFPVAVLAALVSATSTLTFKQHYLVDAIAGAALGVAAWWTCFRWKSLQLRGTALLGESPI